MLEQEGELEPYQSCLDIQEGQAVHFEDGEAEMVEPTEPQLPKPSAAQPPLDPSSDDYWV